MQVLNHTNMLDAQQIENILDKLLPIIAKEEDYDFFRGVLTIKFENCSSSEAAALVHKMVN